MPSRAVTKMPVRSLGLNQVFYTMAFVGNDDAAPTVLYDNADGTARFTVSAPATGVFTVQLPSIGGGYPTEIFPVGGSACRLTGDLAGARQLDYVRDSYDSAAGTFELAYQEAGVLVDPTDEVELTFTIVMRLGRVGRQRS